LKRKALLFQLCAFTDKTFCFLFFRSPSLAVTQRSLIVSLFGDFMTSQYDLICLLCWCVGQHATLQQCGGDVEKLAQLLDCYYQPLELLAYELVSEERSERQRSVQL
jgi:hypothetical protein